VSSIKTRIFKLSLFLLRYKSPVPRFGTGNISCLVYPVKQASAPYGQPR